MLNGRHVAVHNTAKSLSSVVVLYDREATFDRVELRAVCNVENHLDGQL